MSSPIQPFNNAVDSAKPSYDLPADDLCGEVLNPALGAATAVSISSAYFSSNALTKIAPGLAAAIASQASVRLLMIPELSEQDWAAIKRATENPDGFVADIIDRIITDDTITESALRQHAADCLGYLVATGRLDVRFVLQREGIFHKKQWLIEDGDARLAVHGSANATTGGLIVNGEQMTIERDWSDGETVTVRLDRMWDRYEKDWNGDFDFDALTVEAPRAVERMLARANKGDGCRPPTVADFWEAWKDDYAAGLAPPPPPTAAPATMIAPAHRLTIPDHLRWRDGRYSHQGRAVDAYLTTHPDRVDVDREDGDIDRERDRGILAIATGGGKTKTSLVIATHIQNRDRDRPLLVVVLAPTTPLVRQWVENVNDFGLTPTVPADFNPQQRQDRFNEIETALNGGGDRTEVIVATIKLFNEDEDFRAFVEWAADRAVTMLIADEVHNFGSPGFIRRPPENFAVRLGLSATPIRQYDDEGTQKLFNFFGPQIFEFDLGEAIAAGCLVEYDYKIHPVKMTHDELDRYRELTEELIRAGFRLDDDGRPEIFNPKIESLLRRRRAVLEQAANKIGVLRDALREERAHGAISHTLIYCSAKGLELADTKQITLVNRLLNRIGIISHELTSEQTSKGEAPALLERFAAGDYQALTAMKVLDEGVDLPETKTAFILASTTVKREWIQRRGRILRNAENKTHATVHDFVVVPATIDNAARSVLRGELLRAREFADLARNRWAEDGPMDHIDWLEELARKENDDIDE